MPTVFLNGSSPAFLGWEFTSSVDLINQLETKLIEAGWTSLNKIAGVNLFVRGVNTNNENCWIEFKVANNVGQTNGKYLVLRGWQEAAQVNASPDNTLRWEYIEGEINRLWLSADSSAGAMCIFPSIGNSKGYHFGFPDSVLSSDPFGWYVGEISSLGYAACYVCKSFVGSTTWKLLSADFNSYGTGATSTAFPLTTFDYLALVTYPSASSALFYTITTNTNPAYFANQGRINPVDNKCPLLPYGYLEGRNATTAYGSAGNNNLPFRGFIKFCYTGVANLAAAVRALDSVTGYRVLSVGGVGWQGMRIS